MTTEPIEEETRRLLAKAAATIEVDASAPLTLTGLPEPNRRRWPVLLAAAAAVVLAITGGFLVSQQLGDEAVEPSGVLPADGAMPSLLGFTRVEAAGLLAEEGYSVRFRKEHSCDQPAGYVLSTDPGPGTAMEPGDRVTVRVTGGIPPGANCVLEPSHRWQQVIDLARFARGLAPAPDFPDHVAVAVGEGRHVELTAEEAADPDSWVLCADGECHSPLAAFAEMLTRTAEMDGFFASTFLEVTDRLRIPVDGRQPVCLTPDPYELGLKLHGETYVYVDHPKTGLDLCPPPPVLQIDWSEELEIAGVRLRLPFETPEPEQQAEPTAERAEAAHQFVAWARGEGPAPRFADRVRLLTAGFHPGWVDEPANRSRYSGCSGLGFPDCGIDPVAAVFHAEGRVDAYAGRPACRFAGAYPRRYLDADQVYVALADAALDECAALVQLWIDADGEIYRLAQVGGPARR